MKIFRFLLLSLIRLYWVLLPTKWRRECIFRVSCSQHVYNVTHDFGFLAGYKALKDRWKKCRGGYRVMYWNNDFRVRLCDGHIVSSDIIADHVLKPYRKG